MGVVGMRACRLNFLTMNAAPAPREKSTGKSACATKGRWVGSLQVGGRMSADNGVAEESGKPPRF